MQSPFVARLVWWAHRFRACTITTNEDGSWCPEKRGLSESVPVRALGVPCAIRYSDIIKRREASGRTQGKYGGALGPLAAPTSESGEVLRHSPLTARTGQLASRR